MSQIIQKVILVIIFFLMTITKSTLSALPAQALPVTDFDASADVTRVYQDIGNLETGILIAASGGKLEPGNPYSRSFPRNDSKKPFDQRKSKVLPQVACGPTAVSMILDTYKKKYPSIGYLALQAKIDRTGTKINSLVKILKKYGILNARSVKNKTVKDLVKATSKGHPAIAHTKLNRGCHYVVVDGFNVQRKQQFVAIRDPAGGKSYYSPLSEFQRVFTGNAVLTNGT